ncbi:hypothetical protein IM697_25935 [Streptomyces ferrugineus]|uniref:Uncharacterized protein n=1 Tax=Streptomyces ferrugineus TaxID=1413221 RepID=A0A7M2SB97_9ACTN|nr:hypothetical protein [Streptomyces ferrugineus]QOV33637.1 hypothetical protein IM697_25935 [Streptomyces ferrugineus]
MYVTTVKLADQVSRAEGVQYGTLYTQGAPTQAQHNGLHVTLRPNGEVTSWIERAKPEPKAKPAVERVLIGTATLADGSTTAKIHRLADDHYEADVFANGTRLDTLVAAGHPAYGEHNGLRVALHPDGELTSWVDPTPMP